MRNDLLKPGMAGCSVSLVRSSETAYGSGADGASWLEPKLQGFGYKNTTPCGQTREKQRSFKAKSMTWRLFRANYLSQSDQLPSGQSR
jgi:hypothetical protein